MPRIFRRLSQMRDLDETNKTAGFAVVVNTAEDGYELAEETVGMVEGYPLFIGDTSPMTSADKYLWIETDGTDFTLWFEDGS